MSFRTDTLTIDTTISLNKPSLDNLMPLPPCDLDALWQNLKDITFQTQADLLW
jgi:hypothetical protein